MNILLVEDEARVAHFIRRGLAVGGWSVDHVADGAEALEQAASQDYDVILLDLVLPGICGLDVCRTLRARKSKTPILLLTAMDSAETRVEGLRTGADDCLPKPFDFNELVARIEALHRRATGYRQGTCEAVLKSGGVIFDRSSLQVYVEGQEIGLSKKERDLLLLFLANQGRVLSRERILNTVWGLNSDPLTNIVDVYVGRVRRKIGCAGDRIVTLRNVGYRMTSCDAASA